MVDIITKVELNVFDQYKNPTGGIPHITEIAIMINREERVSAEYPINPDVETWVKISRSFIDRVERGNINQRKK